MWYDIKTIPYYEKCLLKLKLKEKHHKPFILIGFMLGIPDRIFYVDRFQMHNLVIDETKYKILGWQPLPEIE